MKYIQLPGTDMNVSQIQLGSAEFGLTEVGASGRKVSVEDAFRQMDEFLDFGGNFIDTAHAYSDWVPGELSRSEKCIGKWLTARGNRDKVFIATKGGIDFTKGTGYHAPPIDLCKAEIDNDINESLANLNTDYIDFYWLHRDEPSRPVEEIIDTLNDNVKAGKIRYIGCSNWLPDRIKAANEYAEKAVLMPFLGNQFEWSLARMFMPEAPLDDLPFMNEEMYEFHKTSGMTAFAYSSLGNGFFTKYDQGGEEALPEKLKKHFLNDRTRAAYKRLKKLSVETGYNATQIALAFINSQYKFVGIPITFGRTHEQFLDSMAAGDVNLTPEQVDFLLKED